MLRTTAGSVLSMGLLVGPARADMWDVAPAHDNTSAATKNELIHGSNQYHDMAMQGATLDEDWYRISQKPYASYELVVDATSGRIGGQLLIERVSGGGAALQSAGPVGVGYSQSLAWRNSGGTPIDTELIRVRVQGGACSPTCGPEDVYGIRLYETTYAIPRFNNSSGQVTIVLLQNPAAYATSGVLLFLEQRGRPSREPSVQPARKTAAFNQHCHCGGRIGH